MAGFAALTRGGPAAIRAEALARDLKVSKGSFYWHFDGVPALRAQMLTYWQAQATEAIIAEVAEAEAAEARLRALVAVATDPARGQSKGRAIEAAIRDWGRYDADAARVVGLVDRRRLGFLVLLFEESGQSASRAAQSARLLYAGLIGLEALSDQGLAQTGEDLDQLLTLVLAQG